METADFLKLLGQTGITGVALLVLGRIIYRIGERMIAAIDKVTMKIDEHTKADLVAMSEVREDLATIQIRIDTALDITPIRAQKPPRARTNPEGLPVTAGYYGPRKAPREDG